MIFSIVLILIIFLLLILLSSIWPPSSPWSPWWRTNRRAAKAICELANIDKNDTVYDLGCGDGTLIVVVSKEYGAKAVGVEIDPLRYWIAKIRVWSNNLSDKVLVKRKSFFDEDISRATIVVVYLVPRTLEKLLPKFRKELKKGTKIISCRYLINLRANREDKKNNLRLYVI